MSRATLLQGGRMRSGAHHALQQYTHTRALPLPAKWGRMGAGPPTCRGSPSAAPSGRKHAACPSLRVRRAGRGVQFLEGTHSMPAGCS